MINIGGYSDWVASAQIVKQELKAVGIKLTAAEPVRARPTTPTLHGQVRARLLRQRGRRPDAVLRAAAELYSKNSAPIGKPAASNYERYNNPKVDSLIDQYATDDELGEAAADRQAARGGDDPGRPDHPGHRGGRLVPVQHQVASRGWVTKQNPYAQPAAYEVPDWGVVLTPPEAARGDGLRHSSPDMRRGS